MGFVHVSPFRVAGNYADADFGFTVSGLTFYASTREVKATLQNGLYQLDNFNASSDSLEVELTFSLRRAGEIFSGDRSVCGPSAVMGVALFWESKSSGQRGVGSPVVFTRDSDLNARRIAIKFEEGSLLGEVRISPRLFLHKPCQRKELGFARIPGSILGSFGDDILLSVDRAASSFPIFEFRDDSPGAPLWMLHLDWADPLVDLFSSEHFEVRLNSAHKNYESIRVAPSGDGTAQIPVTLREILSTSIFALFTKLKSSQDSWGRILNGESLPGTIGDLAWNYVTEGHWNSSSVTSLLAEIRREFEN
jgi:hypothetical protein